MVVLSAEILRVMIILKNKGIKAVPACRIAGRKTKLNMVDAQTAVIETRMTQITRILNHL